MKKSSSELDPILIKIQLYLKVDIATLPKGIWQNLRNCRMQQEQCDEYEALNFKILSKLKKVPPPKKEKKKMLPKKKKPFNFFCAQYLIKVDKSDWRTLIRRIIGNDALLAIIITCLIRRFKYGLCK